MNNITSFPANVVADEDGYFLVTFPDVKGTTTGGPSLAEALAEAPDCLRAALADHLKAKQVLPVASELKPGQHLIHLSPLSAAKLALYRALRDAGISNVALAKRLGVRETVVRRMLDLDHDSKIDRINDALVALGVRLELVVKDAA